LKSEISAVSFIPLNPQKAFSSNLIVAYWISNIVELFTIEKGILKSSNESKTPSLPAVVRSVLLYNFGSDTSSKGADYQPYLLAGLGDGSVVSFTCKGGCLTGQKIVSLGHAPVSLTSCVVDGKKAVFAAGNRATVFFCDKNRLVNSAIMLKVSTFNIPGQPQELNLRYKRKLLLATS
jgi:DNA damage-binding protein 1